MVNEALFFVLIVAVLAASVAWQAHQDKLVAADWRALAQRWGLRFEGGGREGPQRIVGELEDIDVEVRAEVRGAGRSKKSFTVLRFHLPGPAPAGLELRREGLEESVKKLFGGQDIELGDPAIDPELRVLGADPEAVREVLHPRVLRDLINLNQRTSHGTRFAENTLVIEAPDTLLRPRLEPLLREGQAVARALNDLLIGPWEGLAHDLGLQLRVEGGSLELEGRLGEHSASVRVQPLGPQGAKVRARVSIGRPLPGGLELRPVVGGARGIGLQDPILDGVVAATAERPEAARAFVQWAAAEVDLHGPLLAVLHGWPGSSVTGQAVQVLSDRTAPSQVLAQIEAAAALARVLREQADRYTS